MAWHRTRLAAADSKYVYVPHGKQEQVREDSKECSFNKYQFNFSFIT
jgi:hypothetical protein